MKLLVSLVLLLNLCGCGFIPVALESKPISIQAESGNISTYFTQQNQRPEMALVNLYNSATSTLDIAIYSLTHKDILKAIVDAKKRGIVVRIVTDAQQAGGESQKVAISALTFAGIPVKKDSHSGLMHLKMSIIDNKIATTGSYNYSMNASSDNDEILVVINDVGFAQKCLGEFNRMWNSKLYTDVK